ncbi:hypothetical protein WJX79_007537 [Trebouxia sp. C0005]
MASQSVLYSLSAPFRKAALPGRSASAQARCTTYAYRPTAAHSSIANPKLLHSLSNTAVQSRSLSRTGVTVRADASQLSARADTTSTPPNDLTQALAVAGFLAVRYGDFNIDAHLILKSLAALQLLVAAVALATRGVHTDRVSGVIGPCALALYALNYSRIPFMTALTALFGYNLSEQLPGPYYVWALSLAAALYYNYGSYWFTAGVSLLAMWNFFKRGGVVNAVVSFATVGVSAYVAYHDATNLWVMILVSAQIAWSGIRTVLGGINIA